MMRRYKALAFTAALVAMLPSQALAWGKTGHRVIGEIAEGHLSPHTRKMIRQILRSETMAEAANWPDFMRADSSAFWQTTANPWHYVTLPEGKAYSAADAPLEGDAVTALSKFSTTVRDVGAPLAERQTALRFIIHIVGDLHQPLHVGTRNDRGGNDTKVTYFGERTNLHAVWDSALIDSEQLSYSEMAAWLKRRITPEVAQQWKQVDPGVWIAESAALHEAIYPPAEQDALGYPYVYANKPRMELRLVQGGLRLAAYLNTLFCRRR